MFDAAAADDDDDDGAISKKKLKRTRSAVKTDRDTARHTDKKQRKSPAAGHSLGLVGSATDQQLTPRTAVQHLAEFLVNKLFPTDGKKYDCANCVITHAHRDVSE